MKTDCLDFAGGVQECMCPSRHRPRITNVLSIIASCIVIRSCCRYPLYYILCFLASVSELMILLRCRLLLEHYLSCYCPTTCSFLTKLEKTVTKGVHECQEGKDRYAHRRVWCSLGRVEATSWSKDGYTKVNTKVKLRLVKSTQSECGDCPCAIRPTKSLTRT